MISFESLNTAIDELATGDYKPSVKFALWVSALSTQQTLSGNCRLADLLRPYIDKPLPSNEHNELWNYLSSARGVLYRSHIRALYHIEALERAGELVGLENIGDNYTAQLDWRKRVYSLVNGYGMAWKTISFAALIIDARKCELVPVDRHVLARLGYDNKCGVQSYPKYLRIEQEVMMERNEQGRNDIPLSHWHWYKWEEYRQMQGKSKSNECESHLSLNCRIR